VSTGRWKDIDPGGNMRGAPELVIEVKSPSNPAAPLRELVALCLANGALECWVVDGQRSVTVVRGEGAAEVYGAGRAVPLAAFGAGEIAVDEIFS
jgi:Uma2 family endonuclease